MEEFLFYIVAGTLLYMLFTKLYAWSVELVGGAQARVNAQVFANDTVRIANERAELDKALVPHYPNGAMPLARKLLEDGQLIEAQFTLLSQEIDARRTFAPVPQTITYSPHMVRNVAALEADVNEPEAPQMQVADFWTLYSAGNLPSAGFLMGYNMADNLPVTANWKQLYSALIGGQSGSGKSTLIRNILAQSALQGGRFVVIDPHYGAGEESLGASLAPLRPLMLCDVAGNEKQMVDALHYVDDIGQRRLAGDPDRTPVILIVDETTALLQRSNIVVCLLATLGRISQETRKVGVFALCIGQQFHGDFFNTTVRNSFVSQISTRTRRDVARTQSGNTQFAKDAETLSVGQAVWMQPDGTVTKIAIPNCTAQHIWQVAQTLDARNGAKASGSPLPSTPENDLPADENLDTAEGNRKAAGRQPEGNQNGDATEVRIVDLFLSGSDPQQIVQTVFGVDSNGGRKYIEKRNYVYDVMRNYWKSDRGA